MPESVTLRIATWNCAGSLHRAWSHLEALNADLVVVQECGPDSVDLVASNGWSALTHMVLTKGHGVFARPGWRLDALPHEEPWWLPTRVRGPVDFTLVSFWGLTPKLANGKSYVSQGSHVAEKVAQVAGPVVLAGDFNATTQPRHLATLSLLEGHGLVSAYHRNRQCERGSEPEATYFHQWKQDSPFHIDLVVVPVTWQVLAVEVGSFDEFTGAKVSDHVPVVATLGVPT